MNTDFNIEEIKRCSSQYILALNDTLNVINGKWKLPIIGTLLYGKKRFKELQRDITKITPRMLSKELKDLENNGIVKRTVYDSTPVMVEYELTESGKTFNNVLDTMVQWGVEHRNKVISN
ncbi:winged helix-turn-helix transcriptional regulator [Urechidicola croceus]|uniref:Transcriptional regulator n=1 Tax=Urechidicola croceus TaxID=1850246 RepID=A0A1D8P5F7_9FLAO|nr:helix-turn-helix domain-containing protein [Urechidicola croceus]AOW19796.1 transcriptional regulator [Urechidicola croceus]